MTKEEFMHMCLRGGRSEEECIAIWKAFEKGVTLATRAKAGDESALREMEASVATLAERMKSLQRPKKKGFWARLFGR